MTKTLRLDYCRILTLGYVCKIYRKGFRNTKKIPQNNVNIIKLVYLISLEITFLLFKVTI